MKGLETKTERITFDALLSLWAGKGFRSEEKGKEEPTVCRSYYYVEDSL